MKRYLLYSGSLKRSLFFAMLILYASKKEHGMTPEAIQKLKNLLLHHESCKQFPYVDTTGHLTIGVGRNLSDRGVSTREAMYLLDEDIVYFSSKLNSYLPCFADLSENRKIALIDMCFNLGVQGLLNFHKMLEYLAAKDYEKAAQEMLHSKWAQQVKERAQCLADIIETDELNGF